MKVFTKVTLALALLACISAPVFSATASAAEPTGYTDPSEVTYNKSGSYIYNWGVRGEESTFLSTYAQSFYEGSYVYSVLSDKAGGTAQADAPSSELYASLQTLMKSKQTEETTYGETRYQYCYTDCEGGGGAISCFYTQKDIGPDWDQGKTWNREHTWPNSKGDDSGNGENDIMMLRPADSSTNSSRGNKAYGEGDSKTFYDPDQDLPEGSSVRGDCARITLYVYTRWGNTRSMWGASGVIESLNILLKWMEEDPVDTWEMGRNDAVQAITGTRNVFVDYPEYAWLLFGKEIPSDMVTPSGEAKKGSVDPLPPDSSVEEPDSSIGKHEHTYGEWETTREPTEEKEGLRQRKCTLCGAPEFDKIPKLGAESSSGMTITVLFGCSSIMAAPISLTLLLSGAYVFCRKKHD